VKTINWKIEGMRCGACARTIEARLVREPGVRQAEVAYPAGTARIFLDADVANLAALIGLLQQAGYRVESQPA
jgi:copper chaperone CopZ